MNSEISNIRKELEGNKPVLIFTKGCSMEPLLYDKSKKNATHVLVEPIDTVMKRGELPLVILPDGRYMIHRIVKVNYDGEDIIYRTRGDNCLHGETVSHTQVIGKVTEIYRKGKTIHVTDSCYRVYARLWMWLYPLRAFKMQCVSLLSKVKRKLR